MPEVSLFTSFLTLSEMTKPLREVIQGSATLLKIAEKPLGIGLAIGLTVGAASMHLSSVFLCGYLFQGGFFIKFCFRSLPKSVLLVNGMKKTDSIESNCCDKQNPKQKHEEKLRLEPSDARTASAFTAFE